MLRTQLKRSCFVPALLALCVGISSAIHFRSEEPEHVKEAKTLVENLQGSSLNVYGGGKRHVDWEARPVTARTVCSSFTTLLLEHTYHWDDAFIKKWIGSTNPEAQDYHDAIQNHSGFLQIVHVGQIKPGDYLAIKYTDHHTSKNGVEDTGHVMLVAEMPQQLPAKAPIVTGTKQYFVTVIDSSASGHGTADSRHIGPGKFTGGIGRGTMRIYGDAEDHVAGYTWSDEKKSDYFTAPARDLVIGRLDRDRMPH